MDKSLLRIDYNAETGEVTEIPLTDAEIAQIQANDAQAKEVAKPTVEQLQAQLATIQAQLTALIPKA